MGILIITIVGFILVALFTLINPTTVEQDHVNIIKKHGWAVQYRGGAISCKKDVPDKGKFNVIIYRDMSLMDVSPPKRCLQNIRIGIPYDINYFKCN
jgi:hypothetical protein